MPLKIDNVVAYTHFCGFPLALRQHLLGGGECIGYYTWEYELTEIHDPCM